MIRLLHISLASLLAAGMTLATAANNPKDSVYGWELMTEQERMEHRETMRNMKTEEERARYREEMHKKMEARAKERGVELNQLPAPAAGRGYGGGQGKGGGR